ncbi:hypothetical protein [Azospirillum argentinense]
MLSYDVVFWYEFVGVFAFRHRQVLPIWMNRPAGHFCEIPGILCEDSRKSLFFKKESSACQKGGKENGNFCLRPLARAQAPRHPLDDDAISGGNQ